jgi:hypothetical protein
VLQDSACSAVSPGGQTVARDSSEESHDTVPVRLLHPQCAFRPLEAGDPHVPLHSRRDDADSSGHAPVDGASLCGRAAGVVDISNEWRTQFSTQSTNVPRPRPVPGVRERSRTHLTWLQQFNVCTITSYFSSFLRYGDNVTHV